MKTQLCHASVLSSGTHSSLLEQLPLAEPTHSEDQEHVCLVPMAHFYWEHGRWGMALSLRLRAFEAVDWANISLFLE